MYLLTYGITHSLQIPSSSAPGTHLTYTKLQGGWLEGMVVNWVVY